MRSLLKILLYPCRCFKLVFDKLIYACRWFKKKGQSSQEPLLCSEMEQMQSSMAQPSQSQTPEWRQVDAVNPKAGHLVDASDFKTESTSVQEALLRVLEYAYLWIFPLGNFPSKSYKLQPLYQLVVKEFIATIDIIKQKTEHIRGPRIVAILICILTQHLQECKQNTGQTKELIFQTPEKKMDFLRRYIKVCTDNWLPASLLKPKLLNLSLIEIITSKVLEPVLSRLSDPDFINQIVVVVLDPIAHEREQAFGRQGAPQSNEGTDLRSMNEDSTVMKLKKKVKKAKNIVSVPKKNKSNEQSIRRRPEASFETFQSLYSDEGIEMLEPESQGERLREHKQPSQDLEDLETKQCWAKLLCKLWKSGNMNIKIVDLQFPKDSGDAESIFCSIRIEDKDDPEDELWAVRKELNDFLQLQDKLCRDPDITRDFPELKKIPLKSILEDQSNACLKRAEKLLNNFLQVLVKLIQASQNMDACLFFIPLEGPDEDWDDLTDVFYELLNLVSEDDLSIKCNTGLADAAGENGTKCSEKYEVPEELAIDHCESGYTKSYFSKFFHLQSLWTSSNSGKHHLTRKSKDERSIFRSLTNDDKKSLYQRMGTRKKKGNREHEPNERMQEEDVKKVLNKLKDCPQPLSEALQRVLKEICTESWPIGGILRMTMKTARWKVEKILEEKCKEYLSENKLASYVDHMREILWPHGRPAAPNSERTSDMKIKTKAKSEALLSGITFDDFWKITLPLIPSVLKRIKLKPNLHNIFQNADDNERLIYMCLFYLSEELIPGLGRSLDLPWLKIKD
uniref:Uncharacterized protein LOC117361316 n=1 Tax=Geotrypetes seraphini TaxID=260995 RepID=A0A6P8QW32_GEOSA|nr:uncharacterized protein LOC117361316 [Geotrypetes seraphini]